ncbi:6-phosphogluconolactonase [Brachybacterium sp. AOP25-B2-12]|uniref:6-phosphogluconolactonase n=1 Tax=Brachybacterium sp. AOP25-B2-12 TaxID=3457710 RepID=UPI0040341BDB
MITTLTDTTSSAIDKKLVEIREEGGVTALGRVLTLIIVASVDDLAEPLAAAVRSSHEHPCRVLVLRAEPDAGSDGLDAEIRVGRDAGAGEIVLLHARGQVATSLDTLVTPLLLPDAPIVAWWPSNAPSSPGQDVLGSMAQRRITDAKEAAAPKAMLKRLRRGYRSGDTDMAWSRITNWRGLVASAFEIPPISVPRSVSVHGDPKDPSVILMVSWLGTELGVPVEVVSEDATAGTLSAVVLHREDGDIVLRRESEESVVMTLPGGTSDQHVTMPRRSLFECLSEELRRLDPDEVYGDALCRAFPAIEDPSTFAAGKPDTADIVGAGPAELAGAAAKAVAGQLAAAIAARGVAHLVLTAGTIGVRTVTELADAILAHGIDTEKLELWWGDERFVNADSTDRNDNAVRAGFLDRLPLSEHRVHTMPSTNSGMGLDDAAAWYGQQLDLAGGDRPFHTRGEAFFDVLLLGVGPDGHVASLFPEHPDQKDSTVTTVAVRDSPKPPPDRLSLTWPVLNSARHVALLVSGAEKAAAVARGHAGIDAWECPASAVRGLESTTWYLDEASAADL